MLDVLCGNKNIPKILIFLFVNGRGYGTQLHRLLKTPLTPLQKAFDRLEKGGIIMSDYVGKTRIYQFDPSYPLVGELESLLKKIYTLLPPQEKKKYYVVKEDSALSFTHAENNTHILLAFWNKLVKVTQLTFHATSRFGGEGRWDGKGKGEVIVTKAHHDVLIFSEKGNWQDKQGKEVGFSNVFRWTLDRKTGLISLEHLRQGPDHPVFLFHLTPVGKHSLSSVDSHLCAEDSYFGQIHFNHYGLRLNWRVIGPKKNEEMNYYYSYDR